MCCATPRKPDARRSQARRLPRPPWRPRGARARAVMGRQGARQDVVETTACRRERPVGAASGLAGRRELDDDPRGLPGLHNHLLRPPAELLVPCLDSVAADRHGLDARRAARIGHAEVRVRQYGDPPAHPTVHVARHLDDLRLAQGLGYYFLEPGLGLVNRWIRTRGRVECCGGSRRSSESRSRRAAWLRRGAGTGTRADRASACLRSVALRDRRRRRPRTPAPDHPPSGSSRSSSPYRTA